MGSYIELNDTLQITTEQGFPDELNLKKHIDSPFRVEDFKGRIFEFKDKPDIRIFHPAPTRVFLAHNIDGKWLYWGHCVVVEQTINALKKTTSGKFKITKIYTPEHQKNMSTYEVSAGKEFKF
ncbi:hypothetical protein K8R32_03600 [bacterium]|nr:hypothetical protein [bacterium]